MAEAERINLANVYFTLIPSMKDSQATMVKELVPAAEKAGDEAGSKAGGRLKGSLGKALAGLATVAGVKKAFDGLYAIGETFDDVTDTIRTGTGAQGKALDGLVDTAKNVGKHVPAEFETIGSTVADVNTRMGLTGPTLEKVASQYLEAGRILGEDVDINATSAAFNAFKIEGEGVSTAMDTLFQVSQATGVGMNDLANQISSNAPAVQALGFSFQDTAALIGSLDKAGLDSSKMMGGMSRALVNLAKDGEQPQDAFKRVVGEIDNFIATGDEAAAIDLASQIFGTRNASQFVGAIKDGTLAMDDLMGATGATSDTILGVGEDTADFAEKWQIVKNNAMLALEPLGSAVFDSLGDALDAVLPSMDSFGSWLSEHTGVIAVFAGVIGATLVAAMVVWTATIWANTAALLANPITWVVVGVVALIAAIVALAMNWDKVTEWVSETWGGFIDWVKGMCDSFAEWWNNLWSSIGDFITTKWTEFTGWVSDQFELFKTGLMIIGQSISDWWNNLWTSIGNFFSNAWESIKNAGSTAAQWIYDNTVGKFNSLKDAVARAFTGMRDSIKRIWDQVKGIAAAPINFVINSVYTNGIKHFVETVAGKVGFKVSLPSIRPIAFAGGGILPGYAPGRDTVPAMLSPGEAVLTPEATRFLGAGFIYGLNRALSGRPAGGGQHFAGGGIVGWFKDKAAGVADFFSDPIGSIAELVTKPVRGLISMIPGNTVWSDMGRGSANSVLDKVVDFFTRKSKEESGAHGLVGAARRALGVPYVWGGASIPPGLDCSGLVYWAARQLGLGWPRLTAAGYQSASRYVSNPLPGDLIFWGNPAHHVAIYEGAGRMIHAPQPGSNVTETGVYGAPSYGRYGGGAGRGSRSTYGGLIGGALAGGGSAGDVQRRLRARQYDSGGWLQPGLQLVYNGLSRPEAVFTPEQMDRLSSRGDTYNTWVEMRADDLRQFADMSDFFDRGLRPAIRDAIGVA